MKLKFEKDDILLCINSSGYEEYLILNKEYKSYGMTDDGRVIVRTENDKLFAFSVKRFVRVG